MWTLPATNRPVKSSTRSVNDRVLTQDVRSPTSLHRTIIDALWAPDHPPAQAAVCAATTPDCAPSLDRGRRRPGATSRLAISPSDYLVRLDPGEIDLMLRLGEHCQVAMAA